MKTPENKFLKIVVRFYLSETITLTIESSILYSKKIDLKKQ